MYIKSQNKAFTKLGYQKLSKIYIEYCKWLTIHCELPYMHIYAYIQYIVHICMNQNTSGLSVDRDRYPYLQHKYTLINYFNEHGWLPKFTVLAIFGHFHITQHKPHTFPRNYVLVTINGLKHIELFARAY